MSKMRTSRHDHQIVPRRDRSVSPLQPLPGGLRGVEFTLEIMSDHGGGDGEIGYEPTSGTEKREVHWIIVAAHDAPDEWKLAADFICDSTNDEMVIMDAMEAANLLVPGYDPDPSNEPPFDEDAWGLWTNGGVLLSPGTFAIDNTIYMSCGNLRGTGMQTQLVSTDPDLFAVIWTNESSYPFWMRMTVSDMMISLREEYLTTSNFQYGVYSVNRSIDIINIGVHGATVGIYTGTKSAGGSSPDKPAVVRDCIAYMCDTGFWIEDYTVVSDSYSIDCRVGFVLNDETSSLQSCYSLNEFSPDGNNLNWNQGNAGIYIYAGQARACHVESGPNSDAGVVIHYGQISDILIYSNQAFGGGASNGVAIKVVSNGTSEELSIENSRIYGNIILNKTGSGRTRGVYFSDCIFKEGAIIATEGVHEMIQILDSSFYRTFDMPGPFVHMGDDTEAVLDNIVFYNDTGAGQGPMDDGVISSGTLGMSGLKFIGDFTNEVTTTTNLQPKNFYGGVEVRGEGAGVFLYSPDGTKFKITVQDDGTLMADTP